MPKKKFEDFSTEDLADNKKITAESGTTINKWVVITGTKIYNYIINKFISLLGGSKKILRVNSTNNDLEGIAFDDLIKEKLQTNKTCIYRNETGNIIETLLPVLKLPDYYVSGYELTGTTNDITIEKGACRDILNNEDLFLISSFIKTFQSFQTGSGNGGLDVEMYLSANVVYYIYQIYRIDTGVGDILYSTDKNFPTLPSQYSNFKLIGCFTTNSVANIELTSLFNHETFYEFGVNGTPYQPLYLSKNTIGYVNFEKLHINPVFARSSNNNYNLKLFDTIEITTISTGSGGNLIGTVAQNTQYYIFLATKNSGNDTTCFISDSLTPVLPVDYIYSVIIGYFKTLPTSTDIWEDTIIAGEAKEEDVRMMAFNIPLSGVLTPQVNLIGEFLEIETSQTGNYSTDFAVSNNHVFLKINNIIGSGTATLTGISINEVTGKPVINDTEIIDIENIANQYYQTSKKWWEIINIDIQTSITVINYDIGVVGYSDLQNVNFKITGYRLDAFLDGDNADLELQIIKIQDDGKKTMSIVDIEKFGFDSGSIGNQIVDNLRTGVDNRNLNPSVANIGLNATTIVLKQNDFDIYFNSNENEIYGKSKHEGFIIKLVGCPNGDISQVEWVNLILNYVIL